MLNKKELNLGGYIIKSRLIVGTGKYKNMQETADAIEASGADMVTVAVRRMNITDNKEERLQDFISPKKYRYLPNSAFCNTPEEALRYLSLAREAGGWDLVKLEVFGSDIKTLYPDIIKTIEANKLLVKEGFKTMVYCNDDPVTCKILEEDGATAIMPLAAPIGSGLGIQNYTNIKFIIEQSNIPVIIDAGVGRPSDATKAMEMGCDGILINSSIAYADCPIEMASAMKHAVIAGRMGYEAGIMAKKEYSNASTTKNKMLVK